MFFIHRRWKRKRWRSGSLVWPFCFDCCSMAGQSRSVSVIVAYLMARQKMSYDEAIQHVRDIKSDIHPNPGFIRQLKLYYEIGCEVGAEYRRKATLMRATALADTFADKGFIDATTLAVDPDTLGLQPYSDGIMKQMMTHAATTDAAAAEPAAIVPVDTTTAYLCFKCRRCLFVEDNIVMHDQGKGQQAFAPRKREKSTTKLAPPECTSWFVEPVAWMKLSVDNDGKIECPKCAARLGSYVWSGAQCSCGSWITPAFQVTKSRLDTQTRAIPH
eukprot:TRINITY_DN15807_c0_g1_i2.p1 TRINITY_DN15807_c0_g1~~TRINITY_DN15807_c0_g1_i2.p1  ORF type:complete len:273 (+),score=25.63 TRINITY_DN15807_c0_g1_i2:247-1065(+)